MIADALAEFFRLLIETMLSYVSIIKKCVFRISKIVVVLNKMITDSSSSLMYISISIVSPTEYIPIWVVVIWREFYVVRISEMIQIRISEIVVVSL